MATLRILLCLDAIQRWYLHQLGINTAFLHSELDEDVYIRKGIAVNKRKYVLDLLKDYEMNNAKLITTPMDYSIKLGNDSGLTYEDVSTYRRLIGRLVYLNSTRPYIFFAIGNSVNT
ncbi:uncharacterized protein LOC130944446 [Arachis stenosperma]|uniref:uncharacterized protein LOC130944446 n=1 Tax=Arachis stenosperma TaxID=217475 RepID=UPI0025ACE5F7|nr:uncharacterized protein LOC130944446 [Arachis stenosperma]